MIHPVRWQHLLSTLWISMIAVCIFTACSKDSDTSAPLRAVMVIPPSDTLKGIIGENTLLTNDRNWYIDSWVYVTNEASLHIEPGAVLKVLGNKNRSTELSGGIIVTRGAKIIAEGTKYAPIIITCDDTLRSYNPVKMGIVLVGRAPVVNPISIATEFPIDNGNLAYGGQLPDDSSGVLKYIQIIYPYAAARYTGKAGTHLSGLFLFGTGSKTVMRNIQLKQVDTGMRIQLK